MKLGKIQTNFTVGTFIASLAAKIGLLTIVIDCNHQLLSALRSSQ